MAIINKHNEHCIKLDGIVNLIDDAVAKNSLVDDYSSLLDICRENGIPAYVLNVLIEHSREDISKRNDSDLLLLEKVEGWMSLPPKPIIKYKDKIVEKEVVTYRWAKSTWILFGVMALLIIACLYVLFNLFYKDPNIRFLLNQLHSMFSAK